jgi:predicted Zn-dependent peptidase
MKKIDLANLDVSCYTEKLDNGLEVFMLPFTNKKNYFISYATRYGSDVVSFEFNGEEYTPPLGIAHFLEHKLFEQESGEDPFTYFASTGSDGNASTSFDNTQYICYGTKNFNNNLSFLINFVNSPYFTDSNVSKEKGIIAEEIKMYGDMPDFKLEMKLRECLYNNSPRRIDIAGSVEEINKITKEDLYNCYNSFYTPKNMFILIVGNFDKDEALNIIKEELDSKDNLKVPKIIKKEEEIEVKEKEFTMYENIKVPKIAIGLKVPTKKLKLNDLELDIYLNMLTTCCFGSSSEFRERVRNSKLLSSIYTDWESMEEFKTFFLMASTIDADELVNEILYEFKNITISEKTFNRIKKVWIANEVKMIDSVDATVNNLYDDILKYKKIIPNKIDIIRHMKLEKLNELITDIDFNNISVVKMFEKED